MNIESNEYIQNTLLNSIISPSSNLGESMGLRPYLNDSYMSKMIVYQTGYLNRLIHIACETILHRLYYLVGDQLKISLIKYFQSQPPHCRSLDEICDGFPEYLSQSNENSFEADFAQLCVKSWHTLNESDDASIGVDIKFINPNSLDQIFLKHGHFYLKSEHPVFDLWRHSDKDDLKMSDQMISDSKQNILLFKENQTTLQTLNIPTDLSEFIENMVAGNSLMEAMEKFFCSRSEHLILDVQNLITVCTQSGAFTLK